MTRDEINTVANLIKRMAVQLEQERSAHKTALAEMRASFVARAGADEKLIEGYRRQIVSLGAANDRLNDLLRVERLAHQDKVATDYREPCDQPKATPVMPKPGDMVRLVSRPERDNVDKNLRTALWWPWEDRWGVVGQTRKVVAGCRYIPGAVAVATDIYAHWPLSCVEVVAEATHAEPDLTQLHAKGREAWSDVPNATQWVEEMRGNTEATHDTEAGKAAAAGLLINGGLDVRKVTT